MFNYNIKKSINCKQLVKDLFNHKVICLFDKDTIRRFCYKEVNEHLTLNPVYLDYSTEPKSDYDIYTDYYRFLIYPFIGSEYDHSYLYSMRKKKDYYDNLFKK